MRLVSGSLVFVFLSLLGAAGAAAEHPGRLGADLLFGRSRIGVEIQPMTPELREFMEAPKDRGVLVVRVLEDSPAAAADIRVGDVITGTGGEPIRETLDLVRAVAAAPEDEPISLTLKRKGVEQSLSVQPEGGAVPWAGPDPWHELGRRWQRGMRDGAAMLRERLEALEKRLEELERREQERTEELAT
ncbi:MAG: PDZ domain-containing protein [bacterium]|nr:PDZ domain-containing protein [bacterium]MCP5065076.1 PDZ domain-containing protein [bacterium]